MQKKPPARNNIAIDIDPEPLASFDCSYPVHKINEYAHRYLREYNYAGSELIYCDPPYLIETRTSKRRYRHEYSRQDHLDLLNLLKTLPCRVILSGYPSALYDDTLEDWNRVELQAMTWGGPRTEKLWYNYEIDRAHWATYAGKDFTDRRPPAYQTQGRALGKELPGAPPSGTARPVGCDHGGGSGGEGLTP